MFFKIEKTDENVNQKEQLDELVREFNVPSFIERDPIRFPRRFTRLQDIEVSAVLTSVITWGKRSSILNDADKMHRVMGYAPYDYIMSKEWEGLRHSRKNIHRTFFEHDLHDLCRSLYAYYSENESLEDLFTPENGGVLKGLARFGAMADMRHVTASIDTSPCKRTNLMLRWLVRNDGIVDLGVWTKIRPADLIIPLDTHVCRIARRLWSNDLPKTDRMATALKITERLKDMCPEDPCKYDFALFGLGEAGGVFPFSRL